MNETATKFVYEYTPNSTIEKEEVTAKKKPPEVSYSIQFFDGVVVVVVVVIVVVHRTRDILLIVVLFVFDSSHLFIQ